MPDGTKLCASFNKPKEKLIVEAYGAAVSVAEIGEQLAWLGAAIRALPLENDKIKYCVPVIVKNLGLNNITSHRSILQPSSKSINFRINFEMEETSATGPNKRCIIVKGYPISQRNVWRQSRCSGQCGGMIGADYWNRSIERLCMREFLVHKIFSKRGKDMD